jgi:hypothetical protein
MFCIEKPSSPFLLEYPPPLFIISIEVANLGDDRGTSAVDATDALAAAEIAGVAAAAEPATTGEGPL